MAMDLDTDIDMGDGMGDMHDMAFEGLGGEDLSINSMQSAQPPTLLTNTSIPTGPANPESRVAVPNKIHLYGLDHLTSTDLEELSKQYCSGSYERIEWIDDSSANLVYANDESAVNALKELAATDISNASYTTLLQMFPAKAFPGHPETVLQVRLAVESDKKQPKARERSRFYLIHPEYDPATNRSRGYRQRDRIPRHADDPKYDEGRRYDRKYRNGDSTLFHETFYDDDDASISSRKRAHDTRRPSEDSLTSGSGTDSRFKGSVGKELFPDRHPRGRSDGRLDGRLRDRSASPVRDYGMSNTGSDRLAFQKQNRSKGQLLKATLAAQRSQKELFPHKATHRRSDAFDATADLFASHMSLDGGSDDRSRKNSSSGFSIRGGATRQNSMSGQGFSIKGVAKSNPRELFPSRGSNSGKELFAERFGGR